MKTPHDIAMATVKRMAAPDAQHLTGLHAVSMATSAIKADREQVRQLGLLSQFVEAYEAYDGQDVSSFLHEWEDYLAGTDEPCPGSADGLHQVTSGSCDQCGSKNRN